jgi:two-component system sensor histidine kinase AlgZ
MDWSLAGLVSIYSGWLSLILVFVWGLLSRLANSHFSDLVELSSTQTGRRQTERRHNTLWMLLWLLGMLVAVMLAQLIFHLGSSRYLPLLPAGVQQWPFLLSSALITAVLSGSLLRYLFIQQRWRNQQEEQARAELRNLQARVHPHFLFNTLNTIAALAEEQPEQAVAAIEDLADLLRQSLAPRERLISLAEELDLAHRYLRLMQWRLGGRLQIDWHINTDIRSDPRWRLPPLTLQVLLENAVLHGIQPSLSGGSIKVLASISSQQLFIRISNPLITASITAGQVPANPAHTGTGTAISDLRRRLQLLFNRPVSLETSIQDGRFEAELRLPAQTSA